MSGRVEQGLALWRQAFRAGKVCQQQIVDELAGRVRPDNIPADIQFITETFQPDLHGFRLLNAAYEKRAPAEQLVGLRRPYAQLAEAEALKASGRQAAEIWLEAALVYRQLQEHQSAMRCARKGLASEPNHYWLRYHLAQSLAALGHFAEAEENLRWCARRKPSEPALQCELRQIVKARIESEGRLNLASTGTQ